jgi:hypothetical protein
MRDAQRRRRWHFKRHNCAAFAFWLWFTRGGYLLWRRTRPPLSFGLHWQWSQDRRRWIHFEPINRETKWHRAALAKLWFKGRLRRYDFPYGQNRTR